MRKSFRIALLSFSFLFGCGGGDDMPCFACMDFSQQYPYTPSSSSSRQSGVIHGASVSYYGETYETVKIGVQTWLSRNLNYAAEGSVCYDNQESNCDIYGRLYNWATAMDISSDYNSSYYNPGTKHRGICPSGWHIPNNAEWDALYRYADGTSGTDSPYDSPTAGRYLKAASGWNDNGNGTDDFGFSALPGGGGHSGGDYSDYAGFGNWWSATEDNGYNAYHRYMDYYYYIEGAYWYYDTKSDLFSVRCLQD
jgi:uncharacterized protein (TIGR02145 family)